MTASGRALLTAFLPAVLLVAPVHAAGGAFDLDAVDLGGLEARSAALLLSGQEGGGLELSVLALPIGESGADGTNALVVLEVGGPELLELPPAPDGNLMLEIYAFALTGEGRPGGSMTRALSFDPAEFRDRLAGGGLRFLGEMRLPPGQVELRVLVLHRGSGRMALRSTPVAVPERDGRPRLLPPVLRRPVGDWVQVRGGGAGESPFPLSLGGQLWVPSARGTVVKGAPAPILVFGSDLEAGLTLRFEGRGLLELELGGVRPAALDGSSLDVAATSVDLTELEAGEIRVRAVLEGRRSPEVRWTLEDEVQETAATRADAPGAERAQDPRPRRRGERRIEDSVREVVRSLVGGDRDGAERRLAALHREELRSGSTEQRERLIELELLAVAGLVRPRVEALLPLIDLYEGVYRDQHAAGDYRLSTHARHVGLALVDLYVEESEAGDASRSAASVMVSMAGYLQEIGDPLTALTLYERALRIDGGHVAALMGRGAILEARAAEKRALESFRRLVRARPDHAEARLHLGVLLRRGEKWKQAREELERVVATAERPWVRAVAFQELASLQAEGGRTEEAVETLRAACEELPDVPRLRLQLAFLFDRAGRPGEAAAVLAGVGSLEQREESPRMTYSGWPTDDLERDRRDLRAAVAARLPELEAALRGGPTPDAGEGGAA